MSDGFPYEMEIGTLDGTPQALEDYRGKVLLVVNTASKCGFTPQFEGLEQLYREYHDQGLEILGFPCNQFGNQDPGDAAEIRDFCSTRFDVSFPMFEKVEVNGAGAHPLFQLLKRAQRWRPDVTIGDDAALVRAAHDLSDVAARLRGAAGAAEVDIDFATLRAASWREGPLGGHLMARGHLDGLGLDDLIGIDRQKERVAANTRQFVAGLPANNALLWGARGTGKSSLVHGLLNAHADAGLRLVEVERTALRGLPQVIDRLAGEPWRFIVFCDDLSFEADDPSYKVLKSVLDGSVFATTDNVLIYATSNRRHLMPEFQRENLEATHSVDGEVHPGETTEEKVSLSDRFGLWVSFQPFPQPRYLEVAAHWVRDLAARAGVEVPFDDEARSEALRWALGRGSRSGRTANHFARHWVGRQALSQRG